MKLLFALGNPEPRSDNTRHNVGFFVADEFARRTGVTFGEKTKFKALIAETTIGGEKVIIAKPTTFYNLVGESYRALADFYKIAPEDTLVIADDLALPFGTMRLREGGYIESAPPFAFTFHSVLLTEKGLRAISHG